MSAVPAERFANGGGGPNFHGVGPAELRQIPRPLVVPTPTLTQATSPSYGEGHDYNKGATLFDRVAAYEKDCIIAPALRSTFNRLVSAGDFVLGCDQMIDIGCGTGHLMLPFLKQGVHVDGFDVSSKMVEVARKRLLDAGFSPPAVRVVDDYSSLDGGAYPLGMMNFVMGCCPTKKDLKNLFIQANYPLRQGGKLIVIGAHPEYLHVRHSACEYDVDDSASLRDGAKVTGRLFDITGRETYELKGGFIWKINTVVSAAQRSGFFLDSAVPIDDTDMSYSRSKSNAPPYICLTFTKKRSVAPAPEVL